MAKAREPKVFRSMDDLPLMLTPYDLMDFLGKGQRQTYELIHSEGFPYVQDGPKIDDTYGYPTERERESRKRIYTEVAPTLRSSRQGVKVVENTTKSDTEKTPPCS